MFRVVSTKLSEWEANRRVPFAPFLVGAFFYGVSPNRRVSVPDADPLHGRARGRGHPSATHSSALTARRSPYQVFFLFPAVSWQSNATHQTADGGQPMSRPGIFAAAAPLVAIHAQHRSSRVPHSSLEANTAPRWLGRALHPDQPLCRPHYLRATSMSSMTLETGRETATLPSCHPVT